MSKVIAIASILAAALSFAIPAHADTDYDMLSRAFSREQSISGERKASRNIAADIDDETARPRKAVRIARNEEDDDRPQRRGAFKPRPRESLTSGSGETGVASYYWEPQALASGGRFNPNALTAAHKTLPFGTRVRVTRVDNGNSVVVVINDRGPYVGGRIIDLSRRAAQEISMTGSGVARVRVAVLGRN